MREASLNVNQGIQSFVAESPEKLCELIRQVRRGFDIVSFTALDGKHICYFRHKFELEVVNGKVQVKKDGF